MRRPESPFATNKAERSTVSACELFNASIRATAPSQNFATPPTVDSKSGAPSIFSRMLSTPPRGLRTMSEILGQMAQRFQLLFRSGHNIDAECQDSISEPSPSIDRSMSHLTQHASMPTHGRHLSQHSIGCISSTEDKTCPVEPADASSLRFYSAQEDNTFSVMGSDLRSPTLKDQQTPRVGRLIADNPERRYEAEANEIPGKPHWRFARDRETKKRVLLKFQPERTVGSNRDIEIHQLLKDSEHICKMLDRFDSDGGQPPCLVFEAGNQTLAEHLAQGPLSAIKQRAILYAIGEALESMHERGIVHGDLNPSNIACFSSGYFWKLMNLEHACRSDEEAPLPDYPCKYMAPEIQEALRYGRRSFRRQSSEDMWSFGVIAAEIFKTPVSASDATEIRDDENRPQASHQEAPEEAADYLSTNPRGRVRGCKDEQTRRFIQSTLLRHPEDRPTIKKSLENSIFFCGADFSTHHELQDDIKKRQDVSSLFRTFITSNLNIHHPTLLRYETETDDGTRRCRRRVEKEVPWFHDEYHSREYPVYLLRIDETYRVRLRIEGKNAFSLTFGDIVSISVRPADEGAHPLVFNQYKCGESVEACAILPLAEFDSERLRSKSPRLASPENKYTELKGNAVVYVRSGEHALKVPLAEKIYCKIMDSQRHLRLYRCYRRAKRVWSALPPSVRSATRCFRSAAEGTVGICL